MTKLIKLFTLFLFLTLWGSGIAQKSLAQETADPEAMKLASQILEVSRVTSGFNNILPAMAERTKLTFSRSNPGLALEIAEVTDQVALSLVQKRVELQERAAQIWVEKFNKQELEAILAFYKTPAGEKFALEYGAVLRDTINLTNEWGKELAEELAAKVRVEMGLRGHKL